MEVFWVCLIISFIFIEACTTNLVTIWFAFASLASLVSSYFTDNVFIQIIVFVSTSVITLIFTKPILDKYIIPNKEKTNVDALIGKVGIVTDEITPLKNGRVSINSRSWLAKSNEEIKKDEKVLVQEIEGAKLIVKKKED